MTPLEFVQDYYRRANLEKQIEAVDLELPLHLYLKVHNVQNIDDKAYYFSKWGLANGTHRIILTKEQNDMFRQIEVEAEAEKQKEIELNEMFDQVEFEVKQEAAYSSSLKNLENELRAEAKP